MATKLKSYKIYTRLYNYNTVFKLSRFSKEWQRSWMYEELRTQSQRDMIPNVQQTELSNASIFKLKWIEKVVADEILPIFQVFEAFQIHRILPNAFKRHNLWPQIPKFPATPPAQQLGGYFPNSSPTSQIKNPTGFLLPQIPKAIKLTNKWVLRSEIKIPNNK